nr:MAG TPA: hypothetical protein [Caudoviricetes sp.]
MTPLIVIDTLLSSMSMSCLSFHLLGFLFFSQKI